MNPLTEEWIQKAERDYHTACREQRVRKFPNYDGVCFHAQQTTEKYLKAVLQENGQKIRHTHNLGDLLGLCIHLDTSFELLQSDLNILEGFAILFRYPGQSASKLEAKSALKAAEIIRLFIRNYLEISD
jgi:HEPN domain-containing protein